MFSSSGYRRHCTTKLENVSKKLVVESVKPLGFEHKVRSKMWRITRLLNFLLCFTTLAYGADNNRGDRTDVIIKNIMSNYDKSVHPNSDRADGAVQVEISLKPLALNIVSETFLSISELLS